MCLAVPLLLFLERLESLLHQLHRLGRPVFRFDFEFSIAKFVVIMEKLLDVLQRVRLKVADFPDSLMRSRVRCDRDQAIVALPVLAAFLLTRLQCADQTTANDNAWSDRRI